MILISCSVLVPLCVLLLSALCGYQLHVLQAQYQAVFDHCPGHAALSGARDPLPDPYHFAREALREAEAVLALPNAEMLEMLVERNESGLLVQSIPVAWGLAVHEIPLQRARATVYSRMNGERVFAHMSNSAFFARLDPVRMQMHTPVYCVHKQ
jgi:hypothetical protein